jgi:hypothetical protein
MATALAAAPRPRSAVHIKASGYEIEDVTFWLPNIIGGVLHGSLFVYCAPGRPDTYQFKTKEGDSTRDVTNNMAQLVLGFEGSKYFRPCALVSRLYEQGRLTIPAAVQPAIVLDAPKTALPPPPPPPEKKRKVAEGGPVFLSGIQGNRRQHMGCVDLTTTTTSNDSLLLKQETAAEQLPDLEPFTPPAQAQL